MAEYTDYSDYNYTNYFGRRNTIYHERNFQRQTQIQKQERIGFDAQNLFSISAVYRMLFLVFASMGIISAAVSTIQPDNGALFPAYSAIRINFLVISAVIFVYQAIIFILDIINAFNVQPLSKIPIVLIVRLASFVLFIFRII